MICEYCSCSIVLVLYLLHCLCISMICEYCSCYIVLVLYLLHCLCISMICEYLGLGSVGVASHCLCRTCHFVFVFVEQDHLQ